MKFDLIKTHITMHVHVAITADINLQVYNFYVPFESCIQDSNGIYLG